MNKTIKLNVTVDHKRFYNSTDMWGVFGLVPNTNKNQIETLDYKNVFVVSGNTPDLKIGESYDIEIEPSYSKKYGKGYSFVSVSAKRPTTPEEQHEYVKMIVTELQYEAISEVYPNEPILDLMEEGKFDYEKVRGIGKTTYNKIKKQLFSNLEIQEAMVELKDLDITVNAIKNLISHFGDARTLVQIVNSNIYKLCEVKGFGFKKIDAYAMKRGDDPNSTSRIRAATIYLLKQDADRGHSWAKISDIKKELEELLGIHWGYIEDFLENIKKEDKTIYAEKDKIALKKNYFYETEFKKKIDEMIEKPSSTSVDNYKKTIAELESKNGFKYTEEQIKAVEKAINNNVLIINGYAGTGKSTLLKAIIHTLSDYSYMSAALSGKAAKVLKENGLRSMTIHKMLMKTVDSETNETYPLPYDIVIIDEASMVNNKLFYEIVMSLKDNAKLIVVGDNGQLPPIGTGAVFDNLIRFGTNIPRQELTIIHRQAQKSGILNIANKVRQGEQISNYNSFETKVFGELKDMVLIPTDKNTNMQKIILDIAKRNKETDLFEFQVITGRVDQGDLSVKNLNIEMQKIFNDVRKPFINKNGYQYRVGDKVIQNGNNYEAFIAKTGFDDDIEGTTQIFNGTLGRIVDIKFDNDNNNHLIYIKFEDEEYIVVYNMEEMNQIGLAYALTTHKVQGSGFNKVVFAFDGSAYMLLSKEFIYTGITRAKKGCIMIAKNRMLHMGINRSHGTSRRTFLKELLENK